MGFRFGDRADALSFAMATGFYVAMRAAGILLARTRRIGLRAPGT